MNWTYRPLAQKYVANDLNDDGYGYQVEVSRIGDKRWHTRVRFTTAWSTLDIGSVNPSLATAELAQARCEQVLNELLAVAERLGESAAATPGQRDEEGQ